MKNYGMKVTKVGISATKSNAIEDLIASTRYPFAKIDPTNNKSFQTIDVTFLSTPPLGVQTTVYSFEHGYDYEPQVWGLWNITYPTTATFVVYDQAYGVYVSGTTSPLFYMRYIVDETNVTLTVEPQDPFVFGLDLIGITARLTLYVFVDDLSAQDYTVDT